MVTPDQNISTADQNPPPSPEPVESAQQLELGQARYATLVAALSPRVTAYVELQGAETNLGKVAGFLDAVQKRQGNAEERLATAQKGKRDANDGAYWALYRAVHEVGTQPEIVIKAWFDHQDAINATNCSWEEAASLRQRGVRDKEAYGRIIPGAKIMKLSYSGSDSPVADVVASPAHLEVYDGSIGLQVCFDTNASILADTLPRGYPYKQRKGLHVELTGLSERLLIGEEAIQAYFSTYEPGLLYIDPETGYAVVTGNEAWEAIEYVDGLISHDLVADNQVAVENMIDAITLNCQTALGVAEDGTITEIDEHAAPEFLIALKRLNPTAYSALYDTIATGVYTKAITQPEDYAKLIRGAELGKKVYNLAMEEGAATIQGLRVRGEELARRQQLYGQIASLIHQRAATITE